MKKIETKKIIKYSYITLLIVCLALSLIFFCSSLIGYYKSITKYNKERQQTEYDFITKKIAYAADMLIPKNADMLYNYYSEKPGEIILYAYFAFTEEPTEILEKYFFKGPDKSLEEIFNEKFYLSKQSKCVPNRYEPNIKNRYLWREDSGYFLFYFPDELTLIAFRPK